MNVPQGTLLLGNDPSMLSGIRLYKGLTYHKPSIRERFVQWLKKLTM